MSMLQKVRKYVDDSFGYERDHFIRTVYWLKRIKPDADEAMMIAAYAHDIARASRRKGPIEFFRDREFNNPPYIRRHQAAGAKRIKVFLLQNGYGVKNTKRVYNMVQYHETGGTPEADIIKDADSVSYMEINALKHVRKFSRALGKGKIRRKIDWMYDRITSPKARIYATPYYTTAIAALR